MSDDGGPFVAVMTVRGPMATLVEEACAAAGVPVRSFDGVTPIPAAAALIVTELRAGDRRVPQRALDAVKQAGGEARLLLLCAEPLARPHVTAQKGRVVMMGPPHSAAGVATRLRVQLSGLAARPGAGALRREARIGDRAWTCAFESSERAASVLVREAAGGTLALLAPPGQPAAPALLGQLEALLGREKKDEARLSGLAQLAGANAVVHLSPGGDRWLVHWPAAAWPLWLHSPQRLPARADVGLRATHERTFSLVAAPGDVLVAYQGALPSTGQARPDLWRAVEEGGPAAVDLLDQAAARTGIAQAGVAVEVHG